VNVRQGALTHRHTNDSVSIYLPVAPPAATGATASVLGTKITYRQMERSNTVHNAHRLPLRHIAPYLSSSPSRALTSASSASLHHTQLACIVTIVDVWVRRGVKAGQGNRWRCQAHGLQQLQVVRVDGGVVAPH